MVYGNQYNEENVYDSAQFAWQKQERLLLTNLSSPLLQTNALSLIKNDFIWIGSLAAQRSYEKKIAVYKRGIQRLFSVK